MKCQALRNVPKSKLELEIKLLEEEFPDDIKRAAAKKAILRYYEANIPVKYWRLEINSKFQGSAGLAASYKALTSNIDNTYKNGVATCYAGSYGVGKTLTTTNILKRASEKGYSALYVNLADIISAMKSDQSYKARRELLHVDFLVIDEFDPRYMGTDAASDFYGRVLEDILRSRSNNRLPIFMCSNSPNPVAAFNGSIQQSISSLMNYVKIVPVLGNDFRAKEGANE